MLIVYHSFSSFQGIRVAVYQLLSLLTSVFVGPCRRSYTYVPGYGPGRQHRRSPSEVSRRRRPSPSRGRCQSNREQNSGESFVSTRSNPRLYSPQEASPFPERELQSIGVGEAWSERPPDESSQELIRERGRERRRPGEIKIEATGDEGIEGGGGGGGVTVAGSLVDDCLIFKIKIASLCLRCISYYQLLGRKYQGSLLP